MLDTRGSTNLNVAAPRWRTLAMTVVVVCNACTQEVEQKSEALGETRDALFQSGTTWPSGRAAVCFDPGNGNNATLLAEAQRVVASTWGRAANITFPGVAGGFPQAIPWQACEDFWHFQGGNFSAIAVHFCGGTSSSANCPPSAYRNGAVQSDAFLGLTPVQGVVPPTSQLTLLGSAIVLLVRPGLTHVSIIADDSDPFLTKFRHQVIHEFGHALGYVDEAFDVNSIMSPIAQDPLTGGPTTFLDGADIVAARGTYARTPSFRGFMMRSDADPTLAIRPLNGTSVAGPIVADTCSTANPDCRWSYHLGMLVSDANPLLAIKASASTPPTLSVEHGCTPSNPACTWTYKAGRFSSDQTPGFAIKFLGAGAPLTLAGNCSPSAPACRWTLPGVMLSSYRNATLAVNAAFGAVNMRDLTLHNACDPTNTDCTWTFTNGLILSDTNLNLMINAFGGALPNSPARLVNNCVATNPDCTWTWSHGQLISDNQAVGVFPINAVFGAFHGTQLRLNSACTASNPDCVFSGLFGRL